MTPAAIAYQLSSWPARRWLAGVVAALLTALAIGVPTDLVPTPLFGRMSPIAWWDYPIWAISALLAGLLAATYVRVGAPATRADRPKLVLGGGVLSFLAVGCPTCNKLVVLALGAGGASSYFAPVQPFLGLVGVALLAATLVVRLRGLAACRIEA